MSVLTTVLRQQIEELETRGQKGAKRLKFHLMPPVGWLNDPNGLCQHRGVYHVFFQYTPFDARGGLKVWGHYTSRDLLSWSYEGTPLLPDTPYDCHGVYSGSALGEEDGLHLFYTGNIKLDGDYDYIHNGRRAYTMLTSSADGIHFGEKIPVLRPEDYPRGYTCHIRDPKVWKAEGFYYMALGGRREDDKGAVLLYRSRDREHWELYRELTTEEPFGYMWECPDVIPMGKQTYLAVSPQGVTREEYRHQNLYQSGYFRLEDPEGACSQVKDFREWDWGFDFYAPQTFLDEKGRRILIGWAGMPDVEEEYQNPTVEEGWQHALTLPRVLREENGILCQEPAEELEALRTGERLIEGNGRWDWAADTYDLELRLPGGGPVRIRLAKGVELCYEDSVVKLTLSPEAGCGRRERKLRLTRLDSLRVLADTSLMELYFNGGQEVMTTRYYTPIEGIAIQGPEGIAGGLWQMQPMQVSFPPDRFAC